MDWLIYSVTKHIMRICCIALMTGVCMLAAADAGVASDSPEFLPYLLYTRIAMLWLFPVFVYWAIHVLIDGRHHIILKALCFLLLLFAWYGGLIPFSPATLAEQESESYYTFHAALTVLAVTALFAYPYTAGYPLLLRRLFLFWACSLLLFLATPFLLIANGSTGWMYVCFIVYCCTATLAYALGMLLLYRATVLIPYVYTLPKHDE